MIKNIKLKRSVSKEGTYIKQLDKSLVIESCNVPEYLTTRTHIAMKAAEIANDLLYDHFTRKNARILISTVDSVLEWLSENDYFITEDAIKVFWKTIYTIIDFDIEVELDRPDPDCELIYSVLEDLIKNGDGEQ